MVPNAILISLCEAITNGISRPVLNESTRVIEC